MSRQSAVSNYTVIASLQAALVVCCVFSLHADTAVLCRWLSGRICPSGGPLIYHGLSTGALCIL